MTRNEAIFLLGKLEEVLKKSHMDSEAEAVALGIYAIGTEEELRKERDAALDLKNESSETRKELDCISREAAIDALRVAYWDNNIQSAKDDPCIIDSMTDWAIRQVKAMPSAQPEIIRCKDCKHSFLHNNGERTNRICGRTRMCGTTPDDWYCADAERRTDE